MSGGGTIGTSDIDFLDIKTAFNNVNGTTSTTDIDLSLFRGCVVTGGSGYSNVTTAGTYTVLSSTTPSYSYTVPFGITSIEVEMWEGMEEAVEDSLVYIRQLVVRVDILRVP